MLAFIHIEKSAGTTLKSILQSNFGPGFSEVRALFPASQKDFDPESSRAYDQIVSDGANPRQFGPRDLKTYRHLNPWLSCFAGHSLRPCLGLESAVPELAYVTILREPTSRYVSYYNHTFGSENRDRISKITFEEFLEKKHFHNFQTKKIACCGDLSAAEEMLDKRFMLVGVMEEFDEFLVLLKRKLGQENFKIDHRRMNIRPTLSASVFDSFRQRIEDNNKLDIELYRYVRETILPRQRTEYGSGLQRDVSQFQRENKSTAWRNSFYGHLQKVFQHVYLDTAAGLIRRSSGFPWAGMY